MILLYNPESILFELLSAARVRISAALQCPGEYVVVSVEPAKSGKVFPNVKIDAPDDAPKGFENAKLWVESTIWVKEVIERIMNDTMKEYRIRAKDAVGA